MNLVLSVGGVIVQRKVGVRMWRQAWVAPRVTRRHSDWSKLFRHHLSHVCPIPYTLCPLFVFGLNTCSMCLRQRVVLTCVALQCHQTDIAV